MSTAGVWHKDGPVAQVRCMADWARQETRPFAHAETIGKIAKNLDAAADALDDQRFDGRELELLSNALAAKVARISRGPGTVTELVELQTLRTRVLELAFIEVSRDA